MLWVRCGCRPGTVRLRNGAVFSFKEEIVPANRLGK
jgi:hypothetical protein